MKIFAIVILTVSSTTFGQILDLDKGGWKLTPSQSTEMWFRVGGRTAINMTQAQATIEVTTSGQSVLAVFTSLIPLPAGSFVSFRMTLPGGVVVPMEGYGIYGSSFISATLWDGSFPSPWISGQTLVEVVIKSPSTGISYVSASIPVKWCCELSGPVQRADVSADGNTVNITASSLNEGTVVATVNGTQVPITISFSPTTGQAVGAVDVRGVLEGEKRLTICAGGSCSTRVIYITRPGPRG